ncbi:MAG: hypothetical protein U0798_04220 [Gemmataceae bacterium]
MAKVILQLQPSEAVVVRAASKIYSAYIMAGKVVEGQEKEAMNKAINEAVYIALTAEQLIQSDDELS